MYVPSPPTTPPPNQRYYTNTQELKIPPGSTNISARAPDLPLRLAEAYHTPYISQALFSNLEKGISRYRMEMRMWYDLTSETLTTFTEID
jgi:hypothetical protein